MATPPRRRLAALVLLPAFAAAGLSACGGDEEDAQEILNKAFRSPIKSADVTLDVEVNAEGVEQLDKPIRVKLSGPYRSNGDRRLPSLDFDLSGSAAGQNFQAGAVVTPDNAFLRFRGQNYEVGEQAVRSFNRQLAEQARTGSETTFEDLGIEPRRWLEDPSKEGDEEVAGVETDHVSAKIDVGKLIEDLNEVVERAGGRITGATPKPLTAQQRRQIEDVVEDPTFDVYVGKDDDTLRRLSGDVQFEVPEGARDRVNGLEGGDISFTIEFANVGGEQRIVPPRDARPIRDLSRQLFGEGALGRLGGSSPGGEPGQGSEGGGARGAETPEAERFRKYSECVNRADSSDLQAIQRCSELLR